MNPLLNTSAPNSHHIHAVAQGLGSNTARKTAAFILGFEAFAEVYGQEGFAAVQAHANVVLPPLHSAQVTDDTFAADLRDVEILFAGWKSPRLDMSLLDSMPRLEAVFFAAGSVRGLVTEEFWRRKISLSTAASVNARPVAEFCLAAILLSLKRVWHQSRLVREMRRFPDPLPYCPSGHGSVVGLVSLGNTGRQLRELLRPFDLHVLVYDPFLTSGQAQQLGVEAVGLSELFERSDVVSLHTPWLATTEGMIHGVHINSMKSCSCLINTARGAIIREAEMLEVLARRPDIEAIIDVTCPEPPAADSPIYQLPNIILTPHIAGSIGRERKRLGGAMLEEFQRYIKGEPLHYAVNAKEYEFQA